MQFVQAKWFHKGRQGKEIRLFVIHDAEAPEKPTTAEAVARYFTTVHRRASAHYCTDNNSTVQCVRDEDTAFGAAGANNDGLHFEQAGYAAQTKEQWLDQYGREMLAELGVVLRAKSAEHGVPLRWLTVAQVRDGHTNGLCTHADVSAAFPAVSTGHHDPGPNYPKAEALAIWLGDEPHPQEDPLMHILGITSGTDAGKWFLVGPTTFQFIDNDDLKANLQKVYGPEQKIDGATWGFIKAPLKPV